MSLRNFIQRRLFATKHQDSSSYLASSKLLTSLNKNNQVESTAKPPTKGNKKQDLNDGKISQKQQHGSKVIIPTQKPAQILNTAKTQGDYQSEYYAPLMEMAKESLPGTVEGDQRMIFMESLIDALARNPTYSMEQKRQAVQVAIDFFSGKKFDLEVKALAGTQQAKAYAKLLQQK